MKSFKSHIATPITEALVRLTPSELNKDNSKTGEPRVDILIRLIQNGDKVELSKGAPIVIQNTPELIAELEAWRDNESEKKAPVGFLDTKGNPHTTSDLGKSAVFGGGGGAGGGTQNTKETESHQCAMLQAMMDHGIQDIEYYTDEIIREAYKSISVDATIDEVLKSNNDDKWKTSSYYSAIFLIKNGYVNKNMRFHRGDKSMNYIYAVKNAAYKNNGFSALKDDKWNPGDIWAIDKSLNLKKALPTSDVGSLNKAILELFTTRKMVGISLKLVKKENPANSEHNVEVPPDTDDHKILKLMLESGRGDFWSGKGGSIVFDEGALELRDGSAFGAVKAELKGKNARGGGAGWSVMIDAMSLVFSGNYNKYLKFKPLIAASAKKIAKGDRKEIDNMWKMYNFFYNNESEVAFRAQLSKKKDVWISAKLGVLFIMYHVAQQSPAKQNRWVTKVVNYAGSKSEDSSAYIKVGK